MSTIKHPTVSVIIPMYNCESYVDSLLCTLSEQTFADFEVICVDDGSTDATLKRALSFCATDDRFSVLSQKHACAGVARNTGIEAACGTYLMFLDTDDVYSECLLQELFAAIEKYQADAVFCFFEEHNYRTQKKRSGLGFNPNVFPEHTLVNTGDVSNLYENIPWAVWNILFRKELIDRYHLRFSSTCTANDWFFIRAYASVAKNMLGIHKQLLTERLYINSQSLCSKRDGNGENHVKAVLELQYWLREHKLYERYKNTLRSSAISNLFFESRFQQNPSFIEAATRLICENDLYQNFDEQTFYRKYWRRNDTDIIRSQITKLKQDLKSNQYEIREYENLLCNITQIEKLAEVKYGRKLNPTNKLKRALSRAARRFKQKAQQV